MEENDNFSQNASVKAVVGRLLERSEVLHAVSLHHLEMGRMGAMSGHPQAHLQSAIALKMGEEARKLDVALLRLLKENPQLKVQPSDNYSRILDNQLKTMLEAKNAKMVCGGEAETVGDDSWLEALGEIIGGKNSLRQGGG